MKKVLITILVTAALLAAVGVTFSIVAPDAVAQIRAALVKNVDEPGRAPYDEYVEFSMFGCSFGGCTNYANFFGVILFDVPAVPVGKRLIITNVSGSLPSNSATGAHFAFQTSQVISLQLVKSAFFGPFFSQSGVVQNFDAAVNTSYGPGEQPHVHLLLPSSNNLIGFINIRGYYIDATN